MTLLELGAVYRDHAEVLKDRIRQLEPLLSTAPEGERSKLEWRLRMLNTMWREARDLALLTEHYYDRGYRRNAKYTL